MKEFSVQEILEFSRSIEMESYQYYTQVGDVAADSELKKLAKELASEEMRHYNRMNQLLNETPLTQQELAVKIHISQADHKVLIETREIPENPTPMAILERSYEREVHTGNMYKTLLTFTNLSQELVETFGDLVDQELGHAHRIQAMIRNLN